MRWKNIGGSKVHLWNTVQTVAEKPGVLHIFRKDTGMHEFYKSLLKSQTNKIILRDFCLMSV